MGGRFNTCDYPYCGAPALAVITSNSACNHKVCERHVKHDCKTIDNWQASSPAMNFLATLGLDELTEELTGLGDSEEKAPKISNKDWGKIIDR